MTTDSAAAVGGTTPAPSWTTELAKTLTAIRERPEAASRCRRGLGKNPMQVPEMWEYCVPLAEAAAAQTRRWTRNHAEAAAHHVLTLYAVHQQSQEGRMHQPRGGTSRDRRSVGAAARQLYDKRESEGARQRFLAAATATSVAELAGHLRHLVPLLREEKIPVDYIGLFRDIADWADPAHRTQVRRLWGLDFHRAVPSASSITSGNSHKETQ